MLRQPARFATLIFSVLLLLAAPHWAAAQGNKPLDFERDFGLSNLPDLGGAPLGGQDVVFSAFIVPPRDGQPPLVAVQAEIVKGYHVYSVTQPDKGPLRTEIEVDKSPAFTLAGKFQPDTPPEVSHHQYYPNVPIEEHRGVVTWLAPLKLAGDADLESLEITGRISGQLCSDNLGTCRPFDLLGAGADRFKAKLATEEELASIQEIPSAIAQADTRGAGDAPQAVGEIAARDNNPIIRGHVEPEVVAPGEMARLVLSVEPKAGWHVYLRGDEVPASGSRPTLIVLTETSGLKAHAPTSDTPVIVKAEQQYYDGKATWVVQLPIPKDTAPGEYKVEGLLGYQVCSDKTCNAPSAVKFRGLVSVGETATRGDSPLGFDESDYATAMSAITSRAAARGGSKVIDYAAIQEQARAERDAKPMIFWMGVAILAGFILNFMPCVLPVIGLKVMSFVQQAGEDRKQIFLLNLVYALGMLSVFWVLATLAAFANFTWSDQFGSVAFNVSLAAIVFLFALSFLGVWEVPIPGFVGSGSASSMAEREGLGGAFAKGILTTLLATPCTGPMLGPALGWAVGKPPLFSYVIFTCVGLGMALPYLIIGAQPRLVKFLPRPGAWMETFKNIMGFVLMATVIFILTYLPIQYVVPTVAFCIGLWAACWWIGRKQHEGLDLSKMVVNWAGAATFAAIVGMVSFMWLAEVMHGRLETLVTDRISEAMERSGSSSPAAESVARVEKSPYELPWEKFSQEAMEKHIAEGRTVFVDFTADWCFNCKENEWRALNTEPMRKLVDEYDVVTLKADLTRRPPELVEMMKKLGHPSGDLPFYAVFPATRPNEPILFSGGKTQAFFLDQIRAAGPSQSPVGRTAMMPTP